MDVMNDLQHTDQPKTALSMVANQRIWQSANNTAFYAMLPGTYLQFYQNWVKNWLYWYDGYVPYIHGGQYGLLSTGIGTTIVNRTADIVFGADVMFSNARKPTLYADIDGKHVGKALDFISNKWMGKVGGKTVIRRAIKDALAAGFSLLKLNKSDGQLWVDAIRADRFYIERSGTEIRRAVCHLSLFEDTTRKENNDRFVLVEDRHYEEIGIAREIPVVEYKIYRTSAPIQIYDAGSDACLAWEDLPKAVKRAFKQQYGGVRLNEPKALNLCSLGVYLLTASDGVSNIPDVGLGESILANVTTYLYEYEYYNTAFNTDMYLARGRVLIPKHMTSPLNRGEGGQPHGLDEFLYTEFRTPDGEAHEPTPIQFEMRSEAWRQARNTLLENVATGIGLSVSTLASYLSDGSNRTAREVSAEESATTLFVESKRRLFEKPINDMLADVLRFYGYADDVEIRWSRAGMTNLTVMVDVYSRAVETGLISRKKAHHLFNFDDDEEQNEEDYALVLEEEREARQSDAMRGWDLGDEQEDYRSDDAAEKELTDGHST